MFDAACGKGYSPVSADLYGFEAPGDAQGNWLPTGLTSEVLPFIEGCVASVEPYDSATGANASMLVQFYDIHDGRFYAFPFQVGIDGLVGYLFGNTHTIITVGEAWAAFTPLVSSQGSCRQVEIQLEATDAAGQASTVRALLDALRVGYDLGSIPSGTTYVTSNFSYYDDTPSNGCY
jgi:hypothetical protein